MNSFICDISLEYEQSEANILTKKKIKKKQKTEVKKSIIKNIEFGKIMLDFN